MSCSGDEDCAEYSAIYTGLKMFEIADLVTVCCDLKLGLSSGLLNIPFHLQFSMFCIPPSSVLCNLACKNGTQGDVQDQDQYNDRSNPKQAPQKHSDLAALILKLPQAPVSSCHPIHL